MVIPLSDRMQSIVYSILRQSSNKRHTSYQEPLDSTYFLECAIEETMTTEQLDTELTVGLGRGIIDL